MITSLICFSLSTFCYCISQLQQQSKLRWQKGDATFWGENAWRRKYKRISVPLNRDNYLGWSFVDAPDNWYYKLINVRYIERWPTSTWLTVSFTDSYHFMQHLFIGLFTASIILYVPMFSWWVDGLVYLGCWYLTFNITYKVLTNDRTKRQRQTAD